VELTPVADGQYVVVGDTGDLDYNPVAFGGAYEVQQPNGLVYTIDATTGALRAARDRNDNALTFTDDGISSNRGRSVTFQRDQAGRIVSITDPRDNSVRYGYDAAGDLVSVTDRAGDPPTTFQYGAGQPHYLTAVIDGQGHAQVTAVFGSDGRLSQLQDAAGNPLGLTYDLTHLTQTSTDPDAIDPDTGLPAPAATVTSFDARGNVTQAVDPQGEQTSATYNNTNPADKDLPDTVTQVGPNGSQTTTLTYDASGDPLTSTAPDGAVTRYSYGPDGEVQAVSDPLGNTVTNEYDANGNLLQTTTA
jgi:YD repeat-containing protein